MVIHPFANRTRLLVAALTAALLPLAFSPTASATTAPQHRTWQVTVGEETPNDAIQGMAFLPGTIWINKGDRIVWTARAGEFHTVTFLAAGTTLPQPFNPFDPNELLPQGGTSYDGVSYFNSGAMTDELNSGFTTQRTYSLTFDKTGNFTYWCLVHGMVMKGTVHVRAAGTPYPLTQEQYNHQSLVRKAALLRHGLHLWAETAEHATNHKVFAGADDGRAMVMRFINANATIRKGSSVTFVNNGMGAPHTITFGPELSNIFVPYGDPTHFTGQPLNSGILAPGQSFKVTFKKSGTFHYICGLHDFLGMTGTVTVKDA
jgi:plastocyanin